MGLHKTRHGAVTVVTFDDGFERATAAEVSAHIAELVPDGGRVLFDFTGVSRLSTPALRVLLLFRRQAGHKRVPLVLTGLSEAVRELMTTTRLIDTCVVVDSVAEGVRELSR